jgi:hypothetical protein
MIQKLRFYVFLVVLCSQVFIYTNAFSESTILDSLFHDERTGQVFINDWDMARFREYSNTLLAWQVDSNNRELKPLEMTLEKISGGSEPIKTQAWLSCDSLLNGSNKQELINLINGNTISVEQSPTKFVYKINDHIVGEAETLIMDLSNTNLSGVFKNKALFGDIKFVNGETHHIVFCVSNSGELMNIHNVENLSDKGKTVKSKFNMDKWLFNNDEHYDGSGMFNVKDKQIYLPVDKKNYILFTFDFLFETKLINPIGNVYDINKNDKKVIIATDIDSKEFNSKIKVNKCDNSNYDISDRVLYDEKVLDEKVHIDYYYINTKYMEYDGYISRYSSNEREDNIKTANGSYKLSNGDVIEQNQCNQNGLLVTDHSRINNSAYGKQFAAKSNKDKKARDTADSLARKKSDDEYNIKSKEEKRNKALREADFQKKLTAFRKSAKLGTHVTGYGGTQRGTITKVNGDTCEVQFNEQLYSNLKYTGSVPYRTETWEHITPRKEWVSRGELGQ